MTVDCAAACALVCERQGLCAGSGVHEITTPSATQLSDLLCMVHPKGEREWVQAGLAQEGRTLSYTALSWGGEACREYRQQMFKYGLLRQQES